MKMMKMMMIMVVMIMMGVALGDIVDSTCKRTPDYTLCLSLLRSNPRSSSADIAGLALILVDQIKALELKTLKEINKAYKTKPTLKRPLDECKECYKAIASDVEEAYQAIPGNPKFGENGVADAAIEALTCERGFPKGKSPLTSLTQRMVKISDIARAIIRNLL